MKRRRNLLSTVLWRPLRSLRDFTQQNTYVKVNQLSEADVNASKVAIAIGIVSLIFGVIISIAITMNITRPLLLIKNKTKEVARGEFGEELILSSPPEIAVLAQSFNFMCAKLQEIDSMKSDFISLMSHELRTPLTTIREGSNLYLEGIQKGTISVERQMKLLTIINEECNRMINLVNSLLDLSKMEAGMMTYSFKKTDMLPLIERMMHEIGPLADTKNIKTSMVIGGKLPRLSIDRERVMQVLRNLVGNAVKFTPNHGDVRVAARMDEKGLKVSVTDSGTGISRDKTEKVFDKYHQTAIASTGKVHGTGLGLSIVRQIINAHGGRVWVEHTSEEGSTFSFILPV